VTSSVPTAGIFVDLATFGALDMIVVPIDALEMAVTLCLRASESVKP
jgi:hypothetical protein